MASAESAVDAISAALREAGVSAREAPQPVGGWSHESRHEIPVFIWAVGLDACVHTELGDSNGDAWPPGGAARQIASTGSDHQWSLSSFTVVPLLAAIWLFASALAGLRLVRTRTQCRPPQTGQSDLRQSLAAALHRCWHRRPKVCRRSSFL